jgi:hypothetical protein
MKARGANPAHEGSKHARAAQRGQSMVEMSLVLPVFLTILAVALTVAQFVVTSVGLHGAARAAAIAAANDVNANLNVTYTVEVTDAATAASLEEGCAGCYVGVANAAACSSAQSCVWITTLGSAQLTGSSLTRIDVIHISHPVAAWVPILRGIAITAQAGATP